MTARGPRHAKRSSFQEVLTNAEWRSGCGMVAPTPARCVATSMARPSRRPFPPTVPYTVPRQGSFESAINPHLTTAREVLTPGERSSRRFVVARCSNARLSPARPRRHYRAPRKARDTHRIYTQVHIDHKLAESAVLFERHLRDSVLPVLCRARPATATGQLPTVDCSHCGKSGIDCANSGTFTDLEEAAHTRTSS